MKLDLHRLRHVVTVAETRSFSQAADMLAITQPALSRSIATLETDLGLRIFDRSRAGVFVTRAGEELIAGAVRLLAQAEALEQEVLQARNVEVGEVKFGMAPLVASIYLPRLLAQLAKAQPTLLLRPLVRKGDELLELLAGGEIDSCYIASPYQPRHDQILFSSIGTVPIGIFARAGHPLAHGQALPPDVLREFSFAASEPQFPGRGGRPSFITSIVCDNYFMMKELMLASDTVCLMSPLLLREELRSGKVVQLDVALIDLIAFDLCAVRLTNRSVSPNTALLQDVFLEILSKSG
ncbi:MAG TPA: LysR family transcriptional regulator [Acidocella sp.]|nr:LysR family transcriptional regulator [Acidocella sp.]